VSGLALDVLPGRLAIHRLAPDAPLADWMWAGTFASVTRTDAELSVVCAEGEAPAEVQVESGWRALRVRGPLVFELTGVITDVVLVREGDLAAASDALRAAGHAVG
jgi:uncharacterized protein